MVCARVVAAGAVVVAPSSPTEAEEVLAEKGDDIALLLTGVVLPERNGRELHDAAVKRFPRLKVVYMSGYTINSIVRRGVLDEWTAFIRKPFTHEDLARTVREALG